MITLSSDFGSPYPAAMKGVLRQRTDADLFDLTHDLPRQDVRESAFWLCQLLPYWPPAVHLVVVDPGVGTDRDAIVLRAGKHALVGPDNGVLVPVARKLATRGRGVGSLECYRVTESTGEPTDPGTDWPLNPASSTFHGRDLFAPAAAVVHRRGISSFQDGSGFEPTESVVDLTLPRASVGQTSATGELLAIDDFGNCITNIPGHVLEGQFGSSVEVNGEALPVERTYATVAPEGALVTVGSHEKVEIAVNRGRGDDRFGVETGMAIELAWETSPKR